ncbi:uncharacterized protein N0V89_012289 [Didymosphaeria variabile]|uniref:Uncharacterized protein n=1 Tax=Didymosphaeria variabile TaxID=1932322 RepID=A0A9W8XAB7_9PLEO|nr:uncharacterized protein N0V89_012289 [Didymosphaeria variabile]KAJ4344545.1 hypothetical protein N0V89_012289 [Didymosphaeria variabile]
MPFYVLKNEDSKGRTRTALRTEPHREGKDMSFLANSKASSYNWTTARIEPAHISITVCGVADRRWKAYAFVDGDEEMSEGEFDYGTVVPDMLTDRDTDANCPIWNPREYFLLVVLIRLDQVAREWESLIRKIVRGVREQTDDSRTKASIASDPEHNQDTVKTYENAIEVLRVLRDTLSDNNEAWTRFSAPHGDIGFFGDFEHVPESSRTHIMGCLREIRSNFGRLSDLQRKLETLERRYQSRVESLERRLTIESNQAAKRSGSISELMVSWVSPAAVVSAVFAIPEPFGNFRRTWKSFAIAMIVVTAILNLLVFTKEKQLLKTKSPKHVHTSILALRDRLPLHQLPLAWRRAHRQNRLLRTDTEATLIEPNSAEMASSGRPALAAQTELVEITMPPACRTRNP